MTVVTRSPRLVLLGAVLGALIALGVAGCNQPVVGRAQTVSVPAAQEATTEPVATSTSDPTVAATVTTQAVAPVVTRRAVVVRTTATVRPAPVRVVVVTVTRTPQAAPVVEASPSSPSFSPPPSVMATQPLGEIAVGGEFCSTPGKIADTGGYVCATTAADPNRLRWRSTS